MQGSSATSPNQSVPANSNGNGSDAMKNVDANKLLKIRTLELAVLKARLLHVSSTPPHSPFPEILVDDLVSEIVREVCKESFVECHFSVAPSSRIPIYLNEKKSDPTFNCPNCTRVVSTAKFAPHLEKCMGKGRGARQARRRTASYGGVTNSETWESTFNDVIDDGDESDFDPSEKNKRKRSTPLKKLGVKKSKK